MNHKLFIRLLGTGTILSNVNHSCSSTLIQYKSTNILIDVGPGTFDKLKQAKISPEQLNYILITHFHPDHISDLVPLLLYYYLKAPEESKEEIQIWGPPGLQDFLQKMSNAYGDWLDPEKRTLKIQELAQPAYEFPDFRLSWEKVVHTSESVGYRFIFDQKTICFSGDSEYCPALVKLCRNATLAILECSYPDSYAIKGHLTPTQVSRIANEAEAERVILTHLYPEAFQADPVRLIKEKFKGEVEIGKDLQIISF